MLTNCSDSQSTTPTMWFEHSGRGTLTTREVASTYENPSVLVVNHYWPQNPTYHTATQLSSTPLSSAKQPERSKEQTLLSQIFSVQESEQLCREEPDPNQVLFLLQNPKQAILSILLPPQEKPSREEKS